jgi:hypothetical protein
LAIHAFIFRTKWLFENRMPFLSFSSLASGRWSVFSPCSLHARTMTRPLSQVFLVADTPRAAVFAVELFWAARLLPGQTPVISCFWSKPVPKTP